MQNKKSILSVTTIFYLVVNCWSRNPRTNILECTWTIKCLKRLRKFFKNYYSISIHSQATSSNGIDIITPKVRTEVVKKGCFYAGAEAFNDLSPELK